MTRQTGVVKHFNPAKGIGFIRQNGGGEDIYFHFSELPTPVKAKTRKTIQTYTVVEFELGIWKDLPCARNIRIVALPESNGQDEILRDTSRKIGKAIWLFLLYLDSNGSIPSDDLLAQELECSVDTVRDYHRTLIKAGLIKERGGFITITTNPKLQEFLEVGRALTRTLKADQVWFEQPDGTASASNGGDSDDRQ